MTADEFKKLARKSRNTKLEDKFYLLCQDRIPHNLPEREHRFHGRRKWRFDFAWLKHAEFLAVEIEGGTWTGGRHTTGKGFQNDLDKYNAAAAMGWLVLRFTGDELEKRPRQVMEMVCKCLNRR